MVMFDSLRKDFLTDEETPNFKRLEECCCLFDNFYAGSLPCMPARREIHSGRYNFLHRSWGPLEPFDFSMPEYLSVHGVHTHIATDHYHYLQDGGATYQGRYSTWSCYRGQESDALYPDILMKSEGFPPNQLSLENASGTMRENRIKAGWQNMKNREIIARTEDFPMYKTFENGLDFIDRNHEASSWFLQIETFDPHEPFTSPLEYNSDESPVDWPQYARVTETEEEIDAMRTKYRALVRFCDERLGKVLERMDRYNLWQNTMLIVNTDHGFMLAEHGYWGKGSCPNYNEIVNIPFYIYDPRSKACGRRKALAQTIDISATVLDFFGFEKPETMIGKSLKNAIETDEKVREYALFGYFGAPIGITDGRYLLLRNVQDASVEVNEYTLMPTHMKGFFTPAEFKDAKLVDGFSFTKGYPVLKTRARVNPRFRAQLEGGDELYDLENDRKQFNKIENEDVKMRLLTALRKEMEVNEAPESLYEYYGLEKVGASND